MNVNARSMVNKLDAIESLLVGLEPDFLAITETWLNTDVKDDDVTPPNYTIIRKDRATRGGGVAIMIKKDIAFTVLPEIEQVEAVFCKLLFGSRPIVVGCVYRSPTTNCDVMETLYSYMQSHVHGGRLILVGDLNLPDIE